MITAEQREQRKKYLGSSEISAVMGLDPYQSAADIWLVKTGRAEPFEGNEATKRGDYLEPGLIRFAVEKLGWAGVATNAMLEHTNGLLACNIDACHSIGPAYRVEEIIEAKSTVEDGEWGEDGTDEVPEKVLAQTAHQFACIPSARIAWVPVVLPGFKSFDFRLYRVERNADLVEAVEAAGVDFMEKFVRRDIRPDDFKPSLEVLKRVKRVPGKTVQLVDEAVAAINRYRGACEVIKSAEREKKSAQEEIIKHLDDAEAATFPGGSLTYMLTKREGYRVAATEFPQLRFKK